jgi:hypothetical protein
MESKFPKTVDEWFDEVERRHGMPPGIGSQALADLIKHTMHRIDLIMNDSAALIEDPYDCFKLMAACAATCLGRFGNGPLNDILPAELMDLPVATRRHAIVDFINGLTLEPEEMNPREKLLALVLQTCIQASYGGKRVDPGDAIKDRLMDVLKRSR